MPEAAPLNREEVIKLTVEVNHLKEDVKELNVSLKDLKGLVTTEQVQRAQLIEQMSNHLNNHEKEGRRNLAIVGVAVSMAAVLATVFNRLIG